MLKFIFLIIGLIIAGAGILIRRRKQKKGLSPGKGSILAAIIGLWTALMALECILIPGLSDAVFKNGFLSSRVDILGLSVGMPVIIGWSLLLVVLVLFTLFRLLLVPNMSDNPKGIQVGAEAAAESLAKVTIFGKIGRKLSAFVIRRKKLLKKLGIITIIWLAIGILVGVLFPNRHRHAFGVEIWAERIDLSGFSLSQTVVISWIIMGIILVLCLLLRFALLPRFKDTPGKAQNVVELIVETVAGYTRSTGGPLGENLPAYILALGLFMVVSAACELLGVRAPTTDITLTFSMALVTFFLINYFGIKEKGVKGRIKSFANPTPIVFPFKLISDIAVPVSMACRLFGNMLAGLIVMELIYFALGNFASGIPGVVGLYFNLFHPLIQVFIFVTLTLTFINEAAE